MLFSLPSFYISDFDFLRHAHNADRLFLGANGSPVVETHDRFFEDIEKRRLSEWLEERSIVELREEISALEAKFRREEDLFGVVPVLVIKMALEGHA